MQIGPALRVPAFGASDLSTPLDTVIPWAPHWGETVPDCGPLNMKLDPRF